MAKTVASRKAKGRRLQQEVRDTILEAFPELTERDVVSQPMGVPGSDIRLSELASNLFSFSVECKNTEKLNIWKALNQSASESRTLTPLLVFKRNNSKTYCALEFKDFIKLILNNKE